MNNTFNPKYLRPFSRILCVAYDYACRIKELLCTDKDVYIYMNTLLIVEFSKYYMIDDCQTWSEYSNITGFFY